MKGIASIGAPKTLLGEWVGGWMDGWVDGRESGVKDCLQQSKILILFLLDLNLNCNGNNSEQHSSTYK
jgi:hypothetical protein